MATNPIPPYVHYDDGMADIARDASISISQLKNILGHSASNLNELVQSSNVNRYACFRSLRSGEPNYTKSDLMKFCGYDHSAYAPSFFYPSTNTLPDLAAFNFKKELVNSVWQISFAVLLTRGQRAPLFSQDPQDWTSVKMRVEVWYGGSKVSENTQTVNLINGLASTDNSVTNNQIATFTLQFADITDLFGCNFRIYGYYGSETTARRLEFITDLYGNYINYASVDVKGGYTEQYGTDFVHQNTALYREWINPSGGPGYLYENLSPASQYTDKIYWFDNDYTNSVEKTVGENPRYMFWRYGTGFMSPAGVTTPNSTYPNFGGYVYKTTGTNYYKIGGPDNVHANNWASGNDIFRLANVCTPNSTVVQLTSTTPPTTPNRWV